jgi:hypothetical protein
MFFLFVMIMRGEVKVRCPWETPIHQVRIVDKWIADRKRFVVKRHLGFRERYP